ncbi:OmpA family protein [Nevskia sp.]|uniref:OmpA family protein n=1 Tax=Nevskia sp. TaxID=1929292 RepID=UPI0025F52B55|nr:OmpA family protein [Nevskia sp.]
MTTKIRTWLSLLGCAAVLAAPQAMALSAGDQQGEKEFYLGAFGAYEIGDGQRESKNGYGFQGTAGWAYSDNSSLELSFLGVGRKRDLDGRKDYLNSLMLNYVRDFGMYEFATPLLPRFKPYVLTGGGAVLEDVRGDSHFHPALNVGAGLLLPLRIGSWDWGWGLRTEIKGLVQYNAKDSAPANENFLVDFQALVGLHIPLSFGHNRKPAPPPADCAVAVVDPVTGRQDCLADSDHDGVQDATDQCPDTVAGTVVNEVGCAVDNGDADHDGVLDISDQCPNTAAGLAVDGQGCAVEQTISLQSVTFETASAVLTGQATNVLDGFARALSGQGNIKAEIAGHTDNVGSPAFNMTLSKQRAAAVREYLIAKGVAGNLLTTTGYGQEQPIASNDDDAGRALNRRVDFRIVLE